MDWTCKGPRKIEARPPGTVTSARRTHPPFYSDFAGAPLGAGSFFERPPGGRVPCVRGYGAVQASFFLGNVPSTVTATIVQERLSCETASARGASRGLEREKAMALTVRACAATAGAGQHRPPARDHGLLRLRAARARGVSRGLDAYLRLCLLNCPRDLYPASRQRPFGLLVLYA